MKKPVVLDICEAKSLFGNKIIRNENESYVSFSVPGRRKFIKQFVKSSQTEKVLVKKTSEANINICDWLIPYKKMDCESIKAVINQVCKSVADKFSLSVPVDEIYIIGTADIAYSLINPLVNICKLFTVICPKRNAQKEDEIYFKYGCIIRHKENLEETYSDNKIVICADDKINYDTLHMPVINISGYEYYGSNIVNIRDVAIIDDKTDLLTRFWGGIPGLEFYSFTGAVPDEYASVDINKKADKIFLLDINKF